MYFEIIGEIESIEPIAIGTSIRDIARLRKRYGTGRWRKLKGTATVRLGGTKRVRSLILLSRAQVEWGKGPESFPARLGRPGVSLSTQARVASSSQLPNQRYRTIGLAAHSIEVYLTPVR